MAIDVQMMSQTERDKLKGKLECEGCGVNARFVRQGTNGKVPCFAASHIPGCLMQNSKKNTSEELRMKEIVRKKRANLEQFGVNYQNYFISSPDDDCNDLIETFDKYGSSHRTYQKDPTLIVMKQLTLPRILHYAENGLIKSMDISIKLADGYKPISEEVISTDYIDQTFEGKTKLFWGYIVGSDYDIWLNCNENDPYTGFSIKLGQPIKEAFWLSLGKINRGWKFPVPAIVYGKLDYSSHMKPYVEISDITKIYINRRIYKKNLREK